MSRYALECGYFKNKLENILRIFEEIMGKYHMLDANLWGLKG